MILKELFNTLTEKHGGHRLALGDSGRSVEGLALDEDAEGWLGPDEVVVTGRNKLDARFLAAVSEGGAPAVVWRAEGEPSEQTVKNAEELGLVSSPSRQTCRCASSSRSSHETPREKRSCATPTGQRGPCSRASAARPPWRS